MMKKPFLVCRLRCLTLVAVLGFAIPALAQRQMERLGRGMVALHSATSQAYLGWRLLATDPADVGFNLYRSAGGGPGAKLNSLPLTNTTDFVDTSANFAVSNAWYVVPVTNGVEGAAGAPAGLAANAPVRQYLSWPLRAVTNGAAPPYDVKFCWVGDLDGDGEYDYMVDRHSTTVATNEFLQAYLRDGTFLWQMDMGSNSVNQYNIEPGASAISIGDKDNVTVYDLDGDGRAEVCVRTARGVILPDGTTVTGPDDTTQYLSILDGLTGHELARTPITNLWPADGPLNSRFGVMYCDGVRPSLLIEGENRNASGAFQRETMTYDYRNGQLTRRWFHTPAAGANESWGHQIRIMDVNHDGIDDLVEVGSVKNGATGQPLWDTELLHGDRFHVTDIDPDRPGLEMFSIQQNNPTLLATALTQMSDGKIIKKWYSGGVTDVGRGVALDFSPSQRGYEFYSTQPGIFDCKGNQIFANSIWPPEAIWWDADLSRELEDGAGSGAMSPVINKIDANSGTAGRMYSIYNEGVRQQYGGRAPFWGDILGDWREELVLISSDYSELRIYTTKIAATNRLYCLMQNPAYRCQCTCKGYYQASYVDYFLGSGMPPPPPPPVSNAKLVWHGDGTNVWDAAGTRNWCTNWFYAGNANTNPAPFNPGDTVLFDLTGSNNAAVTLTGSLTPGDVRVHSPKNFTLDGRSGSLDGAMGLTKAGAGRLMLIGTNRYTGKTLISEGPLIVNGALPNSPVTVRGGVWLDGRLGGSGVIGAAVTIYEGAGLSPGSGTNSPGTLTIANNLTLTGRTLNDFDLSDDPSGATKTNDLASVTGNLTVTGTNTLVIHPLDTNLPPGTIYPLITYTGALSGSLNNFVVAGLTGIPYALTNPPGQIALVVKSYRGPSTITWTGGQGGNAWDLLATANWLNGAAKDLFAPNDIVRFDNTGASNLTVNLSGDLNAASVVVDSTANYTLAGGGNLFGPASLTKTNSGTLTLSTLNNSYTGKTTIAGGTVVVAELDAIGFPSPLGNPPGGATNLILSGNSTLRITGESYTDRGLTLSAGTNTLEIFNAADQVTIASPIVGAGALVKAGPGTLALTVANPYTGGTFILGGSVSLGSVAGNQNGFGTGLVTISNATVSLIDIEASENCAWNMSVPTNTVNYLNCDGRSTMSGSLIGGGTLNVYTPYVRTDFGGDWHLFAGQINLTGGNFRANNAAGYPAAKINVGSAASFQNRVGGTPTISVGELSGAAGGSCSGSGGNEGLAVNWSVGGLNTSATFGGNTYNGIGFIKVGTGTWTWTGTNLTHTGPTTVNGGTLLFNAIGSNSTSVVTVGAAGTLGGNGSIGGATTVNGKLSPGSNAIGTLVFSGNLTLGGGSTTFIEINKTSGTRDLVDGNATLTFGGTLQVTNLAGALAANDSFKIFDAATYAGSFAGYMLPPLGAGLAWDTTALTASGTLSVIVQTNGVPPAAPGGLIATAVSASQINLTWTDNATNENTFLIERSPDNTNFTQTGSVGINVTNYSDSGLAAATIYYYRVRAGNAAGYSAYSASASATTLAPPPGLVWRGDGAANVWDAGVSSNWTSGGSLATFVNGAIVVFDDTGSNNVAVTLAGTLQPAATTFSAAKNYVLAGTGMIAGTNALIKSGAGTLSMGISNAYSGGTYASGGIIQFTSDTANAYGLGTNTITLTNATLTMYDNFSSYNSSFYNLAVPTNATGTLIADSRCDLYGTLTGGGTLNLRIPSNRTTIFGDWSAFTGTLNALPASGGGDFRIGPAYSWPGLPKAALNLGTNIYAYWTGNLNSGAGGSFCDLGELNGVASAHLAGGTIGGRILTYRVGNRNTDATFAGAITDQSAGSSTLITKVGTGTWTLSGANTYSGLTTISSGAVQIGDGGTTGTPGTNSIVNNATLAFNRSDALSDAGFGLISGPGNLRQLGDGVLTFSNAHPYTGATTIESGTLALAGNGAIANSTNITIFTDALLDVGGHTGGGLTLTSGKTLSGNGAVNGNFTLASGAKLAPGIAIGALTFSNNLTLAAGSATTLEISAGPLAHDQLNVLGNLIRGGTLVVTNTGANPLTAGDSFLLLNTASLSGSFNSLVLPPLGASLAWDTNGLALTGTLTVVSTAPPAFGSVAPLGDGSFRLTFSGPTGQYYELRATTDLGLQPITLWDLVASGTFGIAPVTFDDLQATNTPQRFYRIRLP